MPTYANNDDAKINHGRPRKVFSSFDQGHEGENLASQSPVISLCVAEIYQVRSLSSCYIRINFVIVPMHILS
jgi:hypothetical protein